MKKTDLFKMCLQNLRRRKARTMLTVLGVVIGACAIIIMISIGVGMKESQEKMLSEMSDLTIITVYPSQLGAKKKPLNAAATDKFRQMKNVVFVTPKLGSDDLRLRLIAGKNKRFVSDYFTLVGMDKEAPQKLEYALREGEYLQPNKDSVLLGDMIAYQFQDTRRPKGHNMIDLSTMYKPDGTMGEKPDPYFDPMSVPYELAVDVTVGDKTKTLTFPLMPAGIMKENMGKGMETTDGVVMDYQQLAKIIESAQRLSGDKRNKKNEYQSVLVKVKDIHSVAEVEKEIKRQGYQTNSMESIRKPMEDEAKQKQMVLGGLGAISLFVAALGITNTMIMSISERTREIGIMKALGCFVRDIRSVFLLEAGCIGFIGGVAGIAISSGLSVAMNLLRSKEPIASLDDALRILSAHGSRVSVIPLWLPAFAMLFSILIGLGAGYYPANKAVKISALEAIKHE